MGPREARDPAVRLSRKFATGRGRRRKKRLRPQGPAGPREKPIRLVVCRRKGKETVSR